MLVFDNDMLVEGRLTHVHDVRMLKKVRKDCLSDSSSERVAADVYIATL